MGHLKIHCDNCGYDWIVYSRDIWKDWKHPVRLSSMCPMCGESIKSDTWERHVLRAFEEMESATRKLASDHAQQHGTLFTVAYEPDVIYPNKNDGVDQLREDIEDLRESVSSLEVILIE